MPYAYVLLQTAINHLLSFSIKETETAKAEKVGYNFLANFNLHF
jgi:hypothetical protein